MHQRIAAGGANYAIGLATIGFGVSNTQLEYNDGAKRRLTNYDVNVRYQVTPALQLVGVYALTDGRAQHLPGETQNTLDPRWNQSTLGANYSLSKATDLYLSAIYQKAGGDGTTLVNGRYKAVASIAYAGTSSSSSQTAVFAGLRHRF
jgi:general bacterial porin, GBP family